MLTPFSEFIPRARESIHRVQILSVDRASKMLSVRGRIEHEFQPPRSGMVGETLASISRKQLVTADISKPDQPAVLADLLLAWPVQRVVAVGDFLYQIADGSAWGDSASALRISTTPHPNAILSEFALGNGTTLDAASVGGSMFVLRTEGMEVRWDWGIVPESIARLCFLSMAEESVPAFFSLEVNNVANPLAPLLFASSSVALSTTPASWETGRLLFPSPNCLAVFVRISLSWWRWGGWRGPNASGQLSSNFHPSPRQVFPLAAHKRRGILFACSFPNQADHCHIF